MVVNDSKLRDDGELMVDCWLMTMETVLVYDSLFVNYHRLMDGKISMIHHECSINYYG